MVRSTGAGQSGKLLKNTRIVGLVLAAVLGLQACKGVSNRVGAENENPGGGSLSGKPTPPPGGGGSGAAMSSLARSAGEVTYLRLNALFPSGGLNLADFNILSAEGSNRSMAAMERPYTSLAQMKLREISLALCDTVKSAESAPVYSTTDIVIAPEVIPVIEGSTSAAREASEALRAAFIAARNIWLDIGYTASSPEVAELATLYQKVKERSVFVKTADPVLDARKAVCLAAILAPQFWLGSSSKTDAIRRAALDLGRRLPTFKEQSDYLNGKLTMKDYVTSLQRERGYFSAVRTWHQEWLGLRPYIFSDPSRDSRPSLGSAGGGSSQYFAVFQFNNGNTNNAPIDGNYITPKSLVAGSTPIEQPSRVVQEFDPDSSLVLFEHKTAVIDSRTSTGKWNLIRAWYKGAVGETQFNTYLNAIYPAAVTSAIKLQCVDNMGWKVCNGLIELAQQDRDAVASLQTKTQAEIDNPQNFTVPGNGLLLSDPKNKTRLDNLKAQMAELAGRLGVVSGYYLIKAQDFRTPVAASGQTGRYIYVRDRDNYIGSFNPYDDLNPRVAVLTINDPNDPSSSTIYGFSPSDRRGRRWASSGEQNGFSIVKPWYTRGSAASQVYVSNVISRFAATCYYRPTSANYVPSSLRTWNAADTRPPSSITGWLPESLMSGPALDSFKCGLPDVATLSNIKRSAYSKASDYVTAVNGTYGNAAPFNEVVTVAQIDYGETHMLPEALAHRNLFSDLHEEPYYLLFDILQNNKDYRLILKADYTCGGDEIERFYKTRGYYLPSNYDATISGLALDGSGRNCANPLSTRVFKEKRFSGAIPASFLVNSTTGAEEPDIALFNTTGVIPGKTLSGILTMPALLGPVSTGMRTLAARYFIRLMCGEANSFIPNDGEKAMQAAYVSSRPHLRTECVSCHINIDPLASALSQGFAANEGKKPAEARGEMLQIPMNGTYLQPVNGVRGGGPVGVGALLGKQVSGVKQVAETLADSTQFNRCVVQKAFENIYGRQIALEDVKMINDVTQSFMTHHNYNKLVLELTDNPTYTRGN